MKLPFARWRVSLWVCGLCLVTSWGAAQNGLFLPDLTLPAGARNQTVFLRASHDVPVVAFSTGLVYDTNELAVTSASLVGTDIPDAEYSFGNVGGGAVTYGVVYDLNPPVTKYLPTGGDHRLLRLTIDVLAPAGSTATLAFQDSLGDDDVVAPILNTLTDYEGASILPLDLDDGEITVAALLDAPPVADAGSDVGVLEGGSVRLDASFSRSPRSLPLAFSWEQVDGPAAASIADPTTARPTITAGEVDTDDAMVFRVTVTDAGGTATDDVTVRVLDGNARTVGISIDPAGVGIIEGEDRAVVWTGDIGWTSPVEGAFLTLLRFTPSGQGDESILTEALHLFVDTNGDGAFGPEDEEIGNPTSVVANNRPVSFDLWRPLADGDTETFFLVADLLASSSAEEAGPGAAGALLCLLVLIGGSTALRPWRRGTLARRAGAVLLVLLGGLLPVGISACSSGGGSDEPANLSREVQFDLRDPADVGLLGAASGVFFEADGFPLEGPPLDV